MTRRRQPQRMTAKETLAECERQGVYLGTDGKGYLYFWNNPNDDFEFVQETMPDRLFGALVRNQTVLTIMVRHMDADMIGDTAAEQFDPMPGIYADDTGSHQQEASE